MSRQTLFAFFAALIFALLMPQVALADGAQTFVQQKHSRLTTLLAQPKSAANDAEVRSVVDALLDYGTLARKSLGSHWDGLTEAQRSEFQSVLTQLVRRAYERDLRKTLNYEVTFTGTEAAAGGTLVKSVARNKDDDREDPLYIDYVLHETGGGWRVFDIVTDGSSLVQSYRNSFGQVIRKDGFDELMRRMRNKLNSG